jgi:hypothetical protein
MDSITYKMVNLARQTMDYQSVHAFCKYQRCSRLMTSSKKKSKFIFGRALNTKELRQLHKQDKEVCRLETNCKHWMSQVTMIFTGVILNTGQVSCYQTIIEYFRQRSVSLFIGLLNVQENFKAKIQISIRVKSTKRWRTAIARYQ